jgi:hypothetical protein
MLNKIFQSAASIFLWFAIFSASAETIVPGGSVLPQGTFVYSENGKYFLVMQTDGNLVLYRKSDSGVRFATYRSGSYAVMQSDGNFVEYTSGNQALWHTSTGGNPGAFLAVQNDGNLVVYSSVSAPLWNIGTDPNVTSDPSKAGDVVGRDFGGVIGAPVGHVGLWDGQRVIEAQGYTSGNTLRIISLGTFKAPGGYWGAAKANIPTFDVFNCFEPRCTNFSVKPWGQSEWVTTRTAIAKRAYQSYLIGADYTFSSQFKRAWAGDYYYPAQRGLYRCDTFVLETLLVTGGSYVYHQGVSNANPSEYLAWANFLDSLLAISMPSPSIIYNKLANYK